MLVIHMHFKCASRGNILSTVWVEPAGGPSYVFPGVKCEYSPHTEAPPWRQPWSHTALLWPHAFYSYVFLV